jgi:hypothetical protein
VLLPTLKNIKEKKLRQMENRKESINREVKNTFTIQLMQRNLFKVGLVTGCKRNCISCGGNDKDLWDGGHFKAEIYSGVIFSSCCHKQCRKCNRF